MSTHTPGPWHYVPAMIDYKETGAWGTPTIKSRSMVVIPEHFDVEGNDDIDELIIGTDENARLIAATPELFAACKLLLRAWENEWIDGRSHIDVVKAAINKAEGK